MGAPPAPARQGRLRQDQRVARPAGPAPADDARQRRPRQGPRGQQRPGGPRQGGLAGAAQGGREEGPRRAAGRSDRAADSGAADRVAPPGARVSTLSYVSAATGDAFRALHLGAQPVDRAGGLAADQRPVGAHQRHMASTAQNVIWGGYE